MRYRVPLRSSQQTVGRHWREASSGQACRCITRRSVKQCSILYNCKNICYFLWNLCGWRSLNNTYQIFLAPCIRCTDHLCDSCGLTDVNPYCILPLLPMISKCWPIGTSWIYEPATGNCDITIVVTMDAFLPQWCWDLWFKEFVKYTFDPFFF